MTSSSTTPRELLLSQTFAIGSFSAYVLSQAYVLSCELTGYIAPNPETTLYCPSPTLVLVFFVAQAAASGTWIKTFFGGWLEDGVRRELDSTFVHFTFQRIGKGTTRRRTCKSNSLTVRATATLAWTRRSWHIYLSSSPAMFVSLPGASHGYMITTLPPNFSSVSTCAYSSTLSFCSSTHRGSMLPLQKIGYLTSSPSLELALRFCICGRTGVSLTDTGCRRLPKW